MEYLRSPCNDYIEAAVQQCLAIHCTESLGDILIFMTGKEDIEICCMLIQEKLTVLEQDSDSVKPLLILPIYSNLHPELQAKIFKKTKERKVIVATNIAETSLTLDGVR